MKFVEKQEPSTTSQDKIKAGIILSGAREHFYKTNLGNFPLLSWKEVESAIERADYKAALRILNEHGLKLTKKALQELELLCNAYAEYNKGNYRKAIEIVDSITLINQDLQEASQIIQTDGRDNLITGDAKRYLNESTTKPLMSR